MKNTILEFTLVTGEKRLYRIANSNGIKDSNELSIELDRLQEGSYYVVFDGLINKNHVVSVTFKEAE
jgi:hypothetical protein